MAGRTLIEEMPRLYHAWQLEEFRAKIAACLVAAESARGAVGVRLAAFRLRQAINKVIAKSKLDIPPLP